MTRLFRKLAAIQIGDRRFEFPGFRLAFEVVQSSDSTANSAQAQVWGLAETTRATLADLTRPAFTIQAGYEDTIAAVFVGTAEDVYSMRQPPEVITHMIAKDGHAALRRRMSKTLKAGKTTADAIREIAKVLGVDSNDVEAAASSGALTLGVKLLSTGLTLAGTAQEEMDKLGRSYGFDWSIQDGRLVALRPNQALSDPAIVLGPDTGLIGSPTRRRDKDRTRRLITSARSQLQPSIRPGRLITLQAKEISGTFRVLNVKHSGDTASDQYMSEWEGVVYV